MRCDLRIGTRRDAADAVRNISLRNYIPADETDKMTFVTSGDYAWISCAESKQSHSPRRSYGMYSIELCAKLH
jgi:hypothetical protein